MYTTTPEGYPSIYPQYYTQNKIQPSAPPMETASGVNWEKLHAVPEPTCLESQKVRNTVGGMFLALGTVSAGATAYTALAFVAAPVVVIGTFSSLALLTVALTVGGIAFLCMKSTFGDPAYCEARRLEAGHEIDEKHLSYPEIKSKYQDLIDHGIINNDDLNAVFKADYRIQDYPAFVTRHGAESLSLLDKNNKASLKANLLALNPSYKQIKDYYPEALKYGIIDKNDINLLMRNDARNYTTFLECHGKEALSIIDDQNKAALKQSLLANANLNYRTLNSQYPEALSYGIVSSHDIDDIVRLDTFGDYQSFIGKHGTEILPALDKDNKAAVKKGLIGSIAKEYAASPEKQQGLVQVLQRGDCKTLGVCLEDVAAAIVPKECELMAANQWNYKTFIERNGTGALPYADPASKIYLGQQLVALIKDSDQGILEARTTHGKECETLGVPLENIDLALIDQELQSFTDGKFSYIDLLRRNGIESIAKKVNENGPLCLVLRKHFFELPYSYMTSANAAAERDLYAIDESEIKAAVNRDAEKMVYLGHGGFKNKHGLKALHSDILSDKSRAKYAFELKEALADIPAAEIDSYKVDCEALDLSRRDILSRRWENKTIQEILKAESTLFFNALDHEFKPGDWTQKVLEDTKHMTVLQIFRLSPEILRRGILSAQGAAAGESSIGERLKKELSTIGTLENLMNTYPNEIFTLNLIRRDDPVIKALVMGFYIQNAQQILEGLTLGTTGKCLEYLRSNNLDYTVLQRVIQAARTELAEVKRNHERELQSFDALYQAKAAQAEAEKNLSISHARQFARAADAEDNLNRFGSLKRSSDAHYNNLESQLRHLERDQHSNQSELASKRRELGDLYEKRQRLLNHSNAAELTSRKAALEMRIRTLENLPSQQVKGLAAALKALPEVKDSKRELKTLRDELKDVTKELDHEPRKLHEVQLKIDALTLQIPRMEAEILAYPTKYAALVHGLSMARSTKEANDREYARIESDLHRRQAQIGLTVQTVETAHAFKMQQAREDRDSKVTVENELFFHAKKRLEDRFNRELRGTLST